MTQLTEDSKTNIELVKPLCYASFPDNKVLAELTFAQAILEAGLRNSPPSQLALKYNNLFGIKGTGTGGSVKLLTTEYVKGKPIKLEQDFAVNDNIEDSIKQHRSLFERLVRYKPLWECKTFEEVAKAVYRAGYATDVSYTEKLISIYKKYINTRG